jgi:2-polyprenyl-3-methyl-5-hydroxy-6-metoxy-1,4-benzoquinol methylase
VVIAVKENRWLSARIDGEEWLDQGIGTPEAIEQSLVDLRRITRWLGGMRGLADHLYRRIRACGTGGARLLDLGAGGCTIPMAVAQWARGEALPLQILALDLRLTHLRWAQRMLQNWPEIVLVQGDVFAPPLPEGSVDVVISSLLLHHFTAEELIRLLPAWARLARRSLVMTDLVRHPVPYWFMKAAGPVFARSTITRHDAAVSIRRAYRPQELQLIAVQAGFPQAHVWTHFPYRMTLVIDHAEAGPP